MIMNWKEKIKKNEKYKPVHELVSLIKKKFEKRKKDTYIKRNGFLKKHDIIVEILYSLEKIKIIENHNNVIKSNVYSFSQHKKIKSIILRY